MVRSAVYVMLQELIEAEATALIGAERHERTDARTVQRNGHRPRTLSTTAGDPASALFVVVMEAYVIGTSVRKVDDLVKALGADTGISKSEVAVPELIAS